MIMILNKVLKRNSKADWEEVFTLAKENRLLEIPKDILVRSYASIRRISTDFSRPIMRGPQEVNVFWGPSGTGKSHRVFEEVGETYYVKAPLNKWFDGYQGEENIIIDEFRGTVDISHLLKWFDKYPCAVETKGAQVYLRTKKWWLTSNLSPDEWYPILDGDTKGALKRRLTNVVHMMDAFRELLINRN